MRQAASAAVLAMLLAAPSSAAAQSANTLPRVEVGGGAGFLVFGEGTLPSWGPRVSVNFNNRVAVESGVDINQIERSNYGSWTAGMYFTQVKATVRSGDAKNARVFVLAGLIGLFEREHVNEQQYTYNGSLRSYPGHTYTDVTWPFMPTAGIGVEYPIGRHAAIRLDTQAVFAEYGVAVRFGAGVTIPIGHYGR